MAESKKRAKILETRFMGLFIGILVLGLTFLLSEYTAVFSNLETKMVDVHFRLKETVFRENIQEGVSLEERNQKISQDILIIGIDNRSLSTLGKWPFPRYQEANILNSFSRIKDQNSRERALFLDIFFIEPDAKPQDDALLYQAIKSNGRVFLETVLDESRVPNQVEEEYLKRHEVLYANYGTITNITGNWEKLIPFFGVQPPLQPFAAASKGYGHANFNEDFDGIYRRQALVAKSSVLLETIRLDDLSSDTPVNRDVFERLEWVDKKDVHHTVEHPLTTKAILSLIDEMERRAPLKHVDTNNDGEPDESYYVVRKYRDHFVPSITLALALEYFNKGVDDVEVVLDEYILIDSPQYFIPDTGTWVPYEIVTEPGVFDEDGNLIVEPVTELVDEIKIPIDEQGRMLINFMGRPSFSAPGAPQTFPVRSFSGYVANIPGVDPAGWPRTKAVANKLLMVGPFARGMAADEKPTPYGLMYGVEIHANALNTIVMTNFLGDIARWIDVIILCGLVMLVAFMSSRLSTIWSMVATIVLVAGFFVAISIIFEQMALIIDFSRPAMAMLFTFLSVVVYRVMTEERDKRFIKEIFANMVGPEILQFTLSNPPELGGEDRYCTIFFSDIRSFTSFSESESPQKVVSRVNEYLTEMSRIVAQYFGVVNKYSTLR